MILIQREVIEWVTPDLPVLVIRGDATGEILLTSPALDELFGYLPGELKGKPVETLLPDHLRGKHIGYRKDYNALPRPRAMGKLRPLEGQRKNGTRFPLAVILRPRYEQNELVVAGIVFSMVDSTITTGEIHG